MFDTAKTVAPVKKPKAAEKAVFAIPGLEGVGFCDAVIKAVTAMKETYEQGAMDLMADKFVETGMGEGKRPSNFKGVEGEVTASCELRIRSSRSALNADEAELMRENNIPTTVVVDTRDAYVINPEHAHNAGYQKAIQKALGPLIKKGILPDDIIMRQQGVSRTVVGEEALDQVFTKTDPDLVKTLLGVVGVMSIKPKVDGSPNSADLLARVAGMAS